MGLLSGKTIYVAGGAGEVGEGVVQALLKHDASVVVSSRSDESLSSLRDRLGSEAAPRLSGFVGDVGSLDGINALQTNIQLRHPKLDGVVASLGGWWQGASLTRTTLEQWQGVLANNLTSHFLVARTFLSMLTHQGHGAYVLLNGGAAFQPIPKAGLMSIAAAAQLMLKDVLAVESEESGVRVNTLALMTPIKTRSRPDGPEAWLTAVDAGAYVAWLCSDQSTHVKGQTIHFSNREDLATLSG